jgi:hypothetical protein
LVSESEAAPLLEPPVLLPPADPEAPPDVEPLALGELALPLVEPDALPLMLPLAPGAELELLELDGGVLAPGAELELLELPEGGVVALGEELELLLELPGLVLGVVLVPLLDDDEAPGRVASPDFWGEVGLRSQPAAASAIATAAATSVR